MKRASVNAGVAPGSGVDLWLEERKVEALHVALAAGVAQSLRSSSSTVSCTTTAIAISSTSAGQLFVATDFIGQLFAGASATPRRQRHCVFQRYRQFLYLFFILSYFLPFVFLFVIIIYFFPFLFSFFFCRYNLFFILFLVVINFVLLSFFFLFFFLQL